MFVKAVGQPSIINNMSAGVTYTVPTGTPRVQITSPYNGQHAGPATNLIAQAMSPNGAIIEYQVYLDRNLVRTLGGGPSFQAWISTSMGIHTIVVKAEDCDHQWSSASVWIDRTY